MATIRDGEPQRAELQADQARLTKWQKRVGICLLLFYVAMIAVTFATLPYVASDVANRVSFE